MVRGSFEVLVTTTSKVKVPPGAGSDWGEAVLTTSMVGGTSVMVTVASSTSVTCCPRGFSPTTVTVSVWASPPLPKKSP